MCRSIKVLRKIGAETAPTTEEEVRAAALQFIRKISGYRVPSQANEAAFWAAVNDVAGTSQRLLTWLETTSRARSAATSH